MKDLVFSVRQICRRNRDGAHKTKNDRMVILSLAAHQLDEMGYRMKSAQGLKPKHIEALVTRWKQEGLSTGTLKNRMSALRWLAEKIEKRSIIARSNDHYGIADRVLVTNVSKARELSEEALATVTCPMTRMSLRLQEAFGLRREESIKIRPHVADRGGRLVLLASWTKGGRERWIPVRTPEQRALLDEARQLARQTKLGSLIERETYKEQLNAFVYQCQRAGIHQVHGHRHLYAQRRYRSITGWRCPAAGGPRSRQLTPEQREIDRRARLIVSAELGHGREQVTAVYLGR